MKLIEKEIWVPALPTETSLLSHFDQSISEILEDKEIPVRFVVTKSGNEGYQCELGILFDFNESHVDKPNSIFDFHKRTIVNSDKFNVVMIVPTGIDAAIGGDAGDATPVARMIAKLCDNLILHPNVVNASDVNEMPENSLYVEGSVLSRLLMGTIGLQKVRSNRILLIVDKHDDKYFIDAAINSASAGRTTFGLDCSVVVSENPIHMIAKYSLSGRATGEVTGIKELIQLCDVKKSNFDTIAITSAIKMIDGNPVDYFRNEMVNPWGGVEAMLTHTISSILNIQSAHSPMMEDRNTMNEVLGIVHPAKAAEAISFTFLHCILKGLHKSPQIITNSQLFNNSSIISAKDISCIVMPDGCLGLPTLAALEQDITVIAVKENRNMMRNDLAQLSFRKNRLFIVENYLEAVGVLAAIKAGVAIDTIKRPLEFTKVIESTGNNSYGLHLAKGHSFKKVT